MNDDAGGCLSGQYLATWLLLRLVGEAEAYASMLIDHVRTADTHLAPMHAAR